MQAQHAGITFTRYDDSQLAHRGKPHGAFGPSPRPSPPRKTTATLLELGTRFLVVFPGGEGATDATLLKAATRANFPSTITFSSAQSERGMKATAEYGKKLRDRMASHSPQVVGWLLFHSNDRDTSSNLAKANRKSLRLKDRRAANS